MYLIENLNTKRDRIIESVKQIPNVTKVECKEINYDKSTMVFAITVKLATFADSLYIAKNIIPTFEKEKPLAAFVTQRTYEVELLFKEQ
jgi:hypothetical protein